MWPRTCSSRAKALPQPSCGQIHCRWPLCRSKCRCSLLAVVNAQLQPSSGQTWGRSPVWQRWCSFSRHRWSKRRPQPSNWHCKDSLLRRWFRACDIMFHLNANDLSQPGCEQLPHTPTNVQSGLHHNCVRRLYTCLRLSDATSIT